MGKLNVKLGKLKLE